MTRDPYAIWVSEIMCQQTQIATVLPYYERWMQQFPTVDSLAAAQEDDVLRQWQGLGYYRRAKMLLAGAAFVAEHGWPASSKEWLKVPGVGAYTAGAIASIALGEAAPLVDGNVERVYARFIGNPASGGALKTATWKWAAEVVPSDAPGDWNQALMELGAVVCTPKAPRCSVCPLAIECWSAKKVMAEPSYCADELPKASPKAATVAIKYFVTVWRNGDLYGLRKIEDGQWWQGMWEFDRQEVSGEQGIDFGVIKHSVTKHRITLEIRLREGENKSLQYFTPSEIERLALPAPMRKIWKRVMAAGGQMLLATPEA